MYRTSFSTITFYVVFHRRSQNFLWGCTSFPQKVDDLFLVVILDTQTKITKLITASLKLSPTLHKFPHNFYFLLRLDKVHLQLTPHKLRPPPKKKILLLVVHVQRVHPQATSMLHLVCVVSRVRLLK